jgi:hypothetical protein
MSTKRATVAAQGVELSEMPEARIERGLEASRTGIGRVNETWDVGLKSFDRASKLCSGNVLRRPSRREAGAVE